jgi:hypothetical protein
LVPTTIFPSVTDIPSSVLSDTTAFLQTLLKNESTVALQYPGLRIILVGDFKAVANADQAVADRINAQIKPTVLKWLSGIVLLRAK